MTRGIQDAAVGAGRVEHPERLLTSTSSGGFVLESPGSEPILARRAPGGWQVTDPAASDEWLLRRAHSEWPGFILTSADGATEVGRSMALIRDGGGPNLYYLLLRDGRMFRILPRGPRTCGFEVAGWETRGAFLIARPGTAGWTIAPTPACGGLSDIGVLSVLLSAEILDAEEAFERKTETGE